MGENVHVHRLLLLGSFGMKTEYFYFKHPGYLYGLQLSKQEIHFCGAQLFPEFVETVSFALLHIKAGLLVFLFFVYCTEPLPE